MEVSGGSYENPVVSHTPSVLFVPVPLARSMPADNLAAVCGRRSPSSRKVRKDTCTRGLLPRVCQGHPKSVANYGAHGNGRLSHATGHGGSHRRRLLRLGRLGQTSDPAAVITKCHDPQSRCIRRRGAGCDQAHCHTLDCQVSGRQGLGRWRRERNVPRHPFVCEFC